MNWVPIDGLQGVDINDQPRILTDQELAYVIDKIPLSNCPDPVTAANVRTQTMAFILKMLRNQKVCPSGINQLVNEMVRFYYRSQVEPGSSVGLIASEALGALITQSTLNTFHSSGSANSATSGITHAQNLIYASKEPRGTTTNLILKDPFISVKDLYDQWLPEILVTYMKDLVSDYSLLHYNLSDQQSVDQLLSQYPWLGFAVNSQGKSLINPASNGQLSTTALVLKINLARLLRHKITLGYLAAVLESEPIDEKQVVRIRVVHSSMEDSTIMIFPYFINQTFPSTENELDFYRIAIIAGLDKIRIRGIPGFTYFKPESINVSNIIESQTLITPDHYLYPLAVPGYKNYHIEFNRLIMSQFGVLPQHLQRLMILAGIPAENIRMDNTNCIVNVPEGSPDPSGLISQQVGDARTQYNKQLEDFSNRISTIDRYSIEHRMEARKLAAITAPDIVKFSEINYIFLLGDDIKELYRLKGVDRSRTHSTHIHRNREMLGIGAAAHFYTKALHKMVSDSGGSIDPSNILIISDCVSNAGQLIGVRFTGLISRQANGHISNATMQRAVEVLSTAARCGAFESTKNASAAITLGVKFFNGSGYNTVIQVVERDGKKEYFTDDSVFSAFNYDPETEVLRQRARAFRKTTPVLDGWGPGSGPENIDFASMITAIASDNFSMPEPEKQPIKIEVKTQGLINRQGYPVGTLGLFPQVVSSIVQQVKIFEQKSQEINMRELKSYLEQPQLPVAVDTKSERQSLTDYLRSRSRTSS